MSCIHIHLTLRHPPKSKKVAKSESWQPIRSRIVEAMLRAGVTPPFEGLVHLELEIEDGPKHDIDNRLLGVFSLLDSFALAGLALKDDGQIKRVLVTRRPWAPGEDDYSVTVTEVI